MVGTVIDDESLNFNYDPTAAAFDFNFSSDPDPSNDWNA